MTNEVGWSILHLGGYFRWLGGVPFGEGMDGGGQEFYKMKSVFRSQGRELILQCISERADNACFRAAISRKGSFNEISQIALNQSGRIFMVLVADYEFGKRCIQSKQ